MPVLCPRCSSLGYVVRFQRGRRLYVYVKHVLEENGRVRYRYCYVGPAEDYEHVQRVHGEMGLTNVMDQDYVMTVEAVVRKHIELVQRLAAQGRRVLAEQQLDRLEKVLRKALEDVELARKELG